MLTSDNDVGLLFSPVTLVTVKSLGFLVDF